MNVFPPILWFFLRVMSMDVYWSEFARQRSDPYVRIDLNTINGDINIDSVLTKTKKKVRG